MHVWGYSMDDSMYIHDMMTWIGTAVPRRWDDDKKQRWGHVVVMWGQEIPSIGERQRGMWGPVFRQVVFGVDPFLRVCTSTSTYYTNTK